MCGTGTPKQSDIITCMSHVGEAPPPTPHRRCRRRWHRRHRRAIRAAKARTSQRPINKLAACASARRRMMHLAEAGMDGSGRGAAARREAAALRPWPALGQGLRGAHEGGRRGGPLLRAHLGVWIVVDRFIAHIFTLSILNIE